MATTMNVEETFSARSPVLAIQDSVYLFISIIRITTKTKKSHRHVNFCNKLCSYNISYPLHMYDIRQSMFSFT